MIGIAAKESRSISASPYVKFSIQRTAWRNGWMQFLKQSQAKREVPFAMQRLERHPIGSDEN